MSGGWIGDPVARSNDGWMPGAIHPPAPEIVHVASREVIPPPPPPTRADQLPRGTRLVAGLGHSVVLPDFDFETYSEAGFEWNALDRKWRKPARAAGVAKGIGLVGAAVYAQHPTTEVLCLAYNLKDGTGPQQWRPGMEPPLALFDYLGQGGLIEAWNVGFERWIWEEVCVKRMGWPPIEDPRQYRCAMAKARAWGLPGKLANAAEVLQVPVRKDADGKRLLDKFSIPRNPTKADDRLRIRPEEDPVDGPRLYIYNLDDIAAEAEVSARVPDLEGEELRFWFADQAINHRGVHIDRQGSEDCGVIVDQVLTQYNAELYQLTGIESASEVQKMLGFLHAQGIHLDSLDEDNVVAALKSIDAIAQAAGAVPPHMRVPYRMLEIRQACGSASVKKVFSIGMQLARGNRLHDLFAYHAARTGRPTGNGPQPTNLPKVGPKVVRCGFAGKKQFALGCGRYHAATLSRCPWCGVEGPPGREPEEWCVGAARDALAAIATRSLHVVEAIFGNALQAVAGCLRGLFIASDGLRLVSSDFTAIEAVVIAALAGETWRLEVFRAKTDIYLESISRSQGIPVLELIDYKKSTGKHHPLRQAGKIQELALGFGGWIAAVRSMAVTIGIDLSNVTDDELKRQIIAWRKASPAIVEWWGGQQRDFGRVQEYFGLEGAVVQAILTPGQWQHVNRLDGSYSGVSYVVHGDVLYCQLPSTRRLAYHRPRLQQTGTWRGYRITFEGWNTNQKKGKPGWMVMDLYGGLLAENVVQATARDIQRNAINECEDNDYPIVLHVYDEDVADCLLPVEGLEAIMSTMPSWAQGWPVSASGGWEDDRYQKA